MKRNKSHKKTIVFYAVAGFLFVFAAFYNPFIDWTTENFGITFTEIIYTALSPLKGADTVFFKDALEFSLPPAIAAAVLWLVYVAVDRFITKNRSFICRVQLKKKQVSFNIANSFRTVILLLIITSLVSTTVKADKAFKIKDYLLSYILRTNIYEEYYVDPRGDVIIAPENPKNLIHIYLESMEATYASDSEGGNQGENNYIPLLTGLANENISFSDCEELGGFKCLTGTSWTMGALFSTTSGVPFSFPVSGNEMGNRTAFAKGITTLGDILNEQGYTQKFLCGSDADFAGRKDYYLQHGNFDIVDLYAARDKNYIPQDYFAWWGFEDSYLYEIAKQELTELYENSEKPFNFTMLTVDTHHVDGYVCDNCPDTYEDQLANVLACADSQIYNFIEWCKQQPFYKDTVIVLTGDHPRMDNTFIAEDLDYHDRVIYNCFINTDKDPGSLKLKNREFTSLDIFPTILSAMNFKIKDNMLGLGVDMFSGEQTLAEKLEYEYLQPELSKYSKYYIDNFS